MPPAGMNGVAAWLGISGGGEDTGERGPEPANWFMEGALFFGLPDSDKLSRLMFKLPISLQVLLDAKFLCEKKRDNEQAM